MTAATSTEVNIVDLVDDTTGAASPSRFEWTSADPLKQFALSTNPFADNVNPEFFFRTESHEDAFILMKRAVEDDASLALCTALSGTGKTLLTQILLQDLNPDKHRAILVLVYPNMSRTALLRDIVSELGIEPPEKRVSIHRLLSIIQREIIRLFQEGQKLVLIIDESHFLGTDSLHLLRTLSNIEVPEKKLISILLFGEETFRKRLENRRTHRALLSRMFVRCTLQPLTTDEVEQYVKFRCLMAGGSQTLFDDGAYAPIVEATGGIPREINRLAHGALLAAARRGQPSVTDELVKEVAQRDRDAMATC